MDTDETEMMIMMQNMEDLQDFSSPINEFHFALEINNNNSTNSNPLPQIIDNPYLNSPTFINPNSTISFTHSPPVPDSTITGQFHGIGIGNINPTRNSMAAMREMIFRVSAMQPIHIDPESVKPPKRRNVKISKDPQSVAARRRRERISERIRILQRIVPGGTKLDTASMLDEAIHYVKFLKSQLQSLQREAAGDNRPAAMCSGNYFRGNSHQTLAVQSLQQFLDV